MNLELVLGLLGGGGILALVAWVFYQWKKLTARAARLENEVRVVTDAFSSQAKVFSEERARAQGSQDLLKAKLGKARDDLEGLVKKVGKTKDPAVVDAVRDIMDDLMSGARGERGASPKPRAVPPSKTTSSNGTRKGRA